MLDQFSQFLDRFSEFFSQRKGLLPLLGIALVIINFILRLTASGWLVNTDLFLHLGVVLAIFGILLSWAL